MAQPGPNKYRSAIDVLQKGRDSLLDTLAEELNIQAEEFLEGGFLFNEFIEAHGTRLHFLGLLMAQLEQSAEALEDKAETTPAPKPAPRKRKPRAKKVTQAQATSDSETEDH